MDEAKLPGVEALQFFGWPEQLYVATTFLAILVVVVVMKGKLVNMSSFAKIQQQLVFQAATRPNPEQGRGRLPRRAYNDMTASFRRARSRCPQPVVSAAANCFRAWALRVQ